MSMIPPDVDRWERDSARLEAGGWLGKGDPPNRAAAVQWAIRQGVPKEVAEQRIVGGSKKALGTSARTVVREEGAAARRRNRQTGGTERADTTLDADGDGAITAADVEAAGEGGSFGEDIFGDIPLPGAANTRGAPLWPYDTSGLSEGELGELTVENKSFTDDLLRFTHKQITGQDLPIGRVGARYYAADALAPLRWSAERRADLQRLMHGLGLYGDAQIRLGTWTAQDQDVFTAVLEYSNVGGTRWAETLSGWRKAGLPPELAEKLKQAQPKRPTIQVTNPTDIRQAAVDVSRELTGEVDRSFAEGSVGGYQGAEVAAQQGVYGDQEAGGGGTVTSAPSMGAYLEDKLRRENPIEVDGYAFLGQFQNFLSMMGVQ